MNDNGASGIRILENLATEARAATDVAGLRRSRSVRSSLRALGFAAHNEFLRVLMTSRQRSYFHFDVSGLRAISHDRRLCRKLQGSFLSEHLLHLLSHESIRHKVTRRFLREMNHCPVSDEEQIWMAAEPLAAAMECGLVCVTRITSLRDYLELADVARRRLYSKAFRFSPPPFTLPDGWR